MTRDLHRPGGRRSGRLNGMLVAGGLILLPLAAVALFAPVLPLDPLSIDATRQLSGPSWEHPFGTDQFGRDVLARSIHGARLSLALGLGAMVLTALFGVVLGALSGWYRWADAIIGRVTDTLMVFPGFVLAILIMAAIGPSAVNVVLAVAVLYVPRVIRTVRASIVEFRDAEFVEAARTVGVGDFRLLFAHLLPKAVGPTLVQLSFGFAWAVLVEAGLSFLGLGTPPPAPSWGGMIAEAREFIRSAWWLITIPGLLITLAVLGLNLVGDGLRDLVDPRLRERSTV